MDVECKGKTPGQFRPVVNPNKCEGKAECVRVCPYDVFEVVRMSDDLYKSLTWRGKLKAIGHGRKTAATPNADRCMNCGLCVEACPETAISLRRFRA